MGMIRVIDSLNRNTNDSIRVTILNEPLHVRKMMLDGSADFAILPMNMAAILYNRGLDYHLAAVPVWGTLYLFGNDTSITEWDHLRGERVHVMAKGMTPDVLFRYLLQKNNIDPDREITLDYSFPTHIDLANPVSKNIEFVTAKDLSREKREKQTEKLIRLVELERFADYYPHKLSDGMRQGVAITRAFAYPSDIILVDEPLKGLNVKLKLNLIQTFIQIWQDDKRTVIFVTHDVDESLLFSDEIVVLSRTPVQIITHEKIEAPLPDRTLYSDYLKELKQRLFNSLT